MLSFLLRRPIAVLMSFLGLLILGVWVIRLLPISLLPDIPIPRISVQLSYSDLAALELEDHIVKPLRNQLLQVNQLSDIESKTRNGQATILLDFEFGTNTDLAFIEVNEKIDLIATQLPRDMERPRVIKANIADIPVFSLSMVSKEPGREVELASFARQLIKRRIEQLAEVAFVDMSGLQQPEIVVQPDFAKLQAMGWSTDDLAQAIRDNELELGNILIQDGQYQFNIRFPSGLQSVEDIRKVFLRKEGTLLQLKDIARVDLRTLAPKGKYLFNGKEAIVFTIRKQANARLFDLKQNFAVLLADLEQNYPQLHFELSNDQSELLQVSIDNLLNSLGYGAFFAFIILFLFFREWRAPVLIGVAIPMALVVAMFGLYLAEISINAISLAGLILGVGLMIDNSIIVIENIRQFRAAGNSLMDACVEGTNEVIRPLISSALTTCSVFLPLIFLSGIAGGLFYDQALSITIALGASLLVAYILLPTLVHLLEPQKAPMVPVERKIEGSRNTFFARSVDLALRFRWLFLFLVLSATISTYVGLRDLKRESFPSLSRQGYSLGLDWNENISLAENERRVKGLLSVLEEELSASQVYLGEQQFLLAQDNQGINEAAVMLFTGASATSIAEKKTTHIKQNYPTANATIAPIKTLFDEIFGEPAAPLGIYLQMASTAGIPAPSAVQFLLDSLEKQGITYNVPPLQTQYFVQILREAALRYGVSYQAIYNQLQTLFNQHNISTLKVADQYIPIQLSTAETGFFELITQTTISNQNGESVPLGIFLDIQRGEAYKEIWAGRGGAAYPIALNQYSDKLLQDIKQWIGKNGQLSAQFAGQIFEDERLIKELIGVFLISLMLLYLILAAQFESLLQPLIVLLTLPIAIGGAGIALWFSGESLNIVSLTGVIVMSGIMVNDAILKVDMMNRLMVANGDLRMAIHGAGQRRIRPILMTSLTTILALTPVLFSAGLGAELQRPLAYTVIGGLVLGTWSSLYLVPVLYHFFSRK